MLHQFMSCSLLSKEVEFEILLAYLIALNPANVNKTGFLNKACEISRFYQQHL